MKPLGLFIKKDITLNEDLYNLVAGKRIAIVGPAPYLKGKNEGDDIDSHDIIVRPNEIIPLSHLRKDYGSRTDIFFCNFGNMWMDGIERKINTDDHLEHFKNLKLVVSSGIKAKHADTDFLSWPDDHTNEITTNFQSINKYDIPFYWIGVPDYKALYRKVGVEFNTGFAAILMLLYYPVKEITLKGFTFFTGGNSYEELFCEGHMDEKDKEGRSFGFHSGHGAHAHMRQIEYFKNLYQENKEVLNVDSEIKQILSI